MTHQNIQSLVAYAIGGFFLKKNQKKLPKSKLIHVAKIATKNENQKTKV